MMLFSGPCLLLCGPYYTVTIVLYDKSWFTPKSSQTVLIPSIIVNDNQLKEVDHQKYLGIIFGKQKLMIYDFWYFLWICLLFIKSNELRMVYK